MKLTGTVVEVASGKQFVDKKRRVTIRFEEADSMFATVRVPDDKLQLDDPIEFYGYGPDILKAVAEDKERARVIGASQAMIKADASEGN